MHDCYAAAMNALGIYSPLSLMIARLQMLLRLFHRSLTRMRGRAIQDVIIHTFAPSECASE